MVGIGLIILVLARGAAILLKLVSTLVRLFAMLLSFVIYAILDGFQGIIDKHQYGRESPTVSASGEFHAFQVRFSHCP